MPTPVARCKTWRCCWATRWISTGLWCGVRRWKNGSADSKFSYAYPSEAAFTADAYSWGLKAGAGFVPTVLTGQDAHDAEPILGPNIQCFAVLERQGHITSSGQYITELASHFVGQGGKLIQAEVHDLLKIRGRIARVDTDQGSFECARAVITAGIWSKELMKKLGLRVPLEPERGYHVLYENPSIMPNHPMMMTAGKFGVNPMEMGLRCAGTVELGNHQSGPNKAPVKLLRKFVAEAFPDLTYSGTSEWMGFRPSTPDSLPLIGELKNSAIYTGFGHQHVGLTAGTKTGRMIAQMIDGVVQNVDMTPFDPTRYTDLRYQSATFFCS